jgi:lysophospholipase L1-like esterase
MGRLAQLPRTALKMTTGWQASGSDTVLNVKRRQTPPGQWHLGSGLASHLFVTFDSEHSQPTTEVGIQGQLLVVALSISTSAIFYPLFKERKSLMMRSNPLKSIRFLAGALLYGVVISSSLAQSVVISTGDSYTRRTGVCDPHTSFPQCWDDPAKATAINSVSYASYLVASTLYTIRTEHNSARGGETCTNYSSFFSGNVFHNYGSLFQNAPKTGLLEQAVTRILNRNGDVVSLLIGINDINFGNRTGAELQACLVSLFNTVTAGGGGFPGKKLIAMTYPPLPVSSVNPWGNNPIAGWNVTNVVNPAIRTAVGIHNRENPTRPVFLADTESAWTVSDAPTYTQPDGAHPNSTGAWKLAREWAKKVCGFGYVACSN